MERIVLGEGYGLGRGMVGDQFSWIGLADSPGSSVVAKLKHDDFDRIVDNKIDPIRRRRKFRLVLEVIEEPANGE